MAENIEERYEKAFRQAGYVQPCFSANARREMAQMVEAIARANEHVDVILATSQDASVKGGFIAEEYHAETFNLDAILKDDNAKAYTDKYSEWNNLEWNGRQLGKNDVPDIVVAREGKVSSSVQSKYYNSAEKTATQMSQTKDGKIKYGDMDVLLGPEDQVNVQYRKVPGETEPVPTTTIKDHAEAKADALQTRNGDKPRLTAYRQTAKKAADKVKDGKSSSRALSKEGADKLGSGDKSSLEKVENEYKTKSTKKQMGQAAAGAAALSAVVSGAVNTIRYLHLASQGEITPEEATVKIVGETVSAAADSAIKASANAGAQSLIVRYGSEEAAVQVIAEQGMKNMLKTNAVTVGVACAVDAIKDLVCLATGNISKDEFFERQGKGLMTTTSGVAGGGLGTAAGVSVATAFGAAEGSLAMSAAALTGGLAGGLIAGLAMTIAIENGIEKPYRDLVRNTENLREAVSELTRLSDTVLKSRIIFTHYIEAENQLEEQFQTQMRRVDEAGKRAMEIISKI